MNHLGNYNKKLIYVQNTRSPNISRPLLVDFMDAETVNGGLIAQPRKIYQSGLSLLPTHMRNSGSKHEVPWSSMRGWCLVSLAWYRCGPLLFLGSVCLHTWSSTPVPTGSSC